MVTQQRGVTLIELLLVITLIAIITSGAILWLRQQAMRQRLHKTAFEMQQVLSAGMNFFVDQKAWPTATSSAPYCRVPDEAKLFVKNYLPVQQTLSTFGSPYCWGASQHGKGPLFWVAAALPASQDQASIKRLANRLAALLPNAIVTSDPIRNTPCQPGTDCYVKAVVTRPGEYASTASTYTVVASGYCEPGDPGKNKACLDRGYQHGHQVYRVVFTGCDASSEPRITAMPNFFDYTNHTKSYRPLADFSAKQQQCGQLGQDSLQQYCDVNVEAHICGGSACVHRPLQGSGTLGISYIVACEHAVRHHANKPDTWY